MSFSKMCLHFKAAFSLKLPTQTVIEQNLHFLIVSIIACLFLLYRHLVFIVKEHNAALPCDHHWLGLELKVSGRKTYRRRCCTLCSLCCSLGLVVFGATIAAVTVDVRLSGALLAVDFTWIRRPSSLGSGLPQEGAHPLNSAPSWHLARKIWAQNNTKIRPNLKTSVWPISAYLKNAVSESEHKLDIFGPVPLWPEFKILCHLRIRGNRFYKDTLDNCWHYK